MVRVQRANLIDPGAPNPSVETLLHAFLPHKYVDHTHATAVLSLADQPDAAERCADLYGGRMGLVPYIMPGFLLAKEAAEIFEADPTVEGLVLLKHGIFTFGDNAREAYERMIAAVTLAEERLARRRKCVCRRRPARRDRQCSRGRADPARRLRHPLANRLPGAYKRFILDFRSGPAVLDYVNGAELARYGQAGVATPDHTIRTKNYPLIVPPPEAGGLDRVQDRGARGGRSFRRRLPRLFRPPQRAPGGVEARARPDAAGRSWCRGSAFSGSAAVPRTPRSPPTSPKLAIETVTDAEAVGRFESLQRGRSLRDGILVVRTGQTRQRAEKPLAGQIAVVTGGAGTIGFATARAMVDAGAEVVLLDIDGKAAEAAAKKLGGRRLASPAT